MWWILAACGGPSADPALAPATAPEAPLPDGWGVAPMTFEARLKDGKFECKSGRTRFTYTRDLVFEAATPKAKFRGTWRAVDGDVVHLTTGPIGLQERCSGARVLRMEDREVLLCAEGPLGCGGVEVDWVIELVDDGAGAEATEKVARLLGGLKGAGVVYSPAEAKARGGRQVQVAFRLPPDGRNAIRKDAERIGAHVESSLQVDGVEVIEDPDLRAPMVVRVGGEVR